MKTKKLFFSLVSAVLVVIASLALVSCGKSKAEIAVVTDVGLLMDGGFNQGTWEGAEAYAKENGKTVKYYQPANGADATDADRIAAMRTAIQNGAKVIVTPGFLQETAIKTVAAESPEVKFIFVDGWSLGLDNVTSISYKEEESGFFAGYAAVKDGYTKLGGTFGGGGGNPACNRFAYGFAQGANAAALSMNKVVSLRVSFQYGSSFGASPELKTQISGWYNSGIEVVFSCGGSMVQSVLSAANETTNGKVIGVDVDQSAESNTVITSATKGLREGTMWALQKYYDGKWDEIADKAANLGAADNAVGLPTETWSLKNWKVSEYEKLLKDIVDGKVTIDNNPAGAETKTYSNVTLDYIR